MKNLIFIFLLIFIGTNSLFAKTAEESEKENVCVYIEDDECIQYAHDKMEEELEEFDIETPEEYIEGFEWWYEFCQGL